jgi:hypothetical protein
VIGQSVPHYKITQKLGGRHVKVKFENIASRPSWAKAIVFRNTCLVLLLSSALTEPEP